MLFLLFFINLIQSYVIIFYIKTRYCENVRDNLRPSVMLSKKDFTGDQETIKLQALAYEISLIYLGFQMSQK